MVKDAWLPIGFVLPGGTRTGTVIHAGARWQIVSLGGGGQALIVEAALAERWVDAGLLAEGHLQRFAFGTDTFFALLGKSSHLLAPVSDCRSPSTKAEAMAFAVAMRATRAIDRESPLQDAIYVEGVSRLLPTYTDSCLSADDVVLGYWLTGGAPIPATAFRALHQTLSWLNVSSLKEIVEAAGFEVEENAEIASIDAPTLFSLPGRPALQAFLQEHVIDIVENQARYKALGVEFPSAIILHGPPGCGKTFAVERLVEHLGWPSFHIDALSVGSPYIHETSRKVAEAFAKAQDNAPSILVIDEMEAFLAERDMGSGHHKVEEVAEFLRRIPEAAKNRVLIIGMTNRIDMIDPAILRRGRFDHVVKIAFADEDEVADLLEALLSALPKDVDVDIGTLAKRLAGRPLSDVAFVVREGARLAARAGRDKLSQANLIAALASAPARDAQEPVRKIGYI